MRLAAETDPATVAWHAFDAAMVAMQRMYREGSYLADARREQALNVVRLWQAFLAAIQPCEPRPAA